LERTNVERLLERQVDGLLFVPVGAGEALPRGLARGAVVIDRLPAGWRGPAVASDHEQGGRLIAIRLTGLGHERIALVAGRGEITSARDRSRGLLDEARHEGVEIPERRR
jgi:LacI family transcriptional regulator